MVYKKIRSAMRPFMPTVSGMVGAVILSGFLTGGAHAAGRAEPADTAQSQWTKQCNETSDDGKQTCLTSHVLFDERGALFGSLAVETVTDRPDPRLLVAVPTGVRLTDGVILQIDGTPSQKLDYRICFADRCFADMTIDNPFLGRMRRGTLLRVGVVDASTQPATLEFKLEGFAGVLDGVSEGTPSSAQ